MGLPRWNLCLVPYVLLSGYGEVMKEESGMCEEFPLLIDELGYVRFLIRHKIDTEYSLDFEVYEVLSWHMDNVPYEKELYVSGVIKWDGCSHVFFGVKNDNGSAGGYIHLCAKDCWLYHVKAMMALYELAEGKISRFNREVAG